MNLLIRANALHIPLADRSVHCCVTSPPYWGLRDYGTAGQIGLEPTPDAYVARMVEVFAEVKRVLRDDGTLWLNLGDSFFGGAGSEERRAKDAGGVKRPSSEKECERCGSTFRGTPKRRFCSTYCGGIDNTPRGGRPPYYLKPKDLCMVPERVALTLQSDGWYLRAKPPWIKPNPMPESTDDRPNVAHESIFLLTKQPTYYFDMDAVRKPSAAATIARDKHSRIVQSGNKSYVPGANDHSGLHKTYSVQHDHETPSDPGGRHLRTNDFFAESLDALIEHHEDYLAHLRKIREDGGMLLSEDGDPLAFWQATQSFKGAHFATWPQRLVWPMILASTSEKGCCPACGAPWRRIIESTGETNMRDRIDVGDFFPEKGGNPSGIRSLNGATYKPQRKGTNDWQPSCSCDSGDPVPCTVFDPFGGAATTVVAAEAIGRIGIATELNPKYLALAKRRLERPHARTPRAGKAEENHPLFGLLDKSS